MMLMERQIMDVWKRDYLPAVYDWYSPRNFSLLGAPPAMPIDLEKVCTPTHTQGPQGSGKEWWLLTLRGPRLSRKKAYLSNRTHATPCLLHSPRLLAVLQERISLNAARRVSFNFDDPVKLGGTAA